MGLFSLSLAGMFGPLLLYVKCLGEICSEIVDIVAYKNR